MNTQTQTTSNTTTRGQRTSKLNANVFAYILECIDGEGYDVELNTDVEKLQFLANCFNSEYNFKANLLYYGSYQNMFANWLMGLPSSFNVEYRNYFILEIAVKWESLPTNYTEKQGDKIIENWFQFIAYKTEQLCRKNKIVLYQSPKN